MIPISQASSFTEMKWVSVRMRDLQPTFRDEKSDDEIQFRDFTPLIFESDARNSFI